MNAEFLRQMEENELYRKDDLIKAKLSAATSIAHGSSQVNEKLKEAAEKFLIEQFTA